MVTKRFVIFTGPPQEGFILETLPEICPDDFVVCADGGYTVCISLGIKPEAVIGDFDSLPGELIREIDDLGIKRIIYPREKDDTDTMHCAKYGIARGFENFLIVGGIGGNFGHTMANMQVLSFLTDMECTAELVAVSERVFMADGKTASALRETEPSVPVIFAGRPGSKFSVLSYAERSSGVFIENARYRLTDAILTQSYPVGVSNEFINDDPVTVSVRYGRLIIIADR